MIITIDGYDGTGKTTLAKALAEKYDFLYLDKPAIRMVAHQYKISFEDAAQFVGAFEKKLFTNSASKHKQITKFYGTALLWLKQFEKQSNIILDRGLLTTYAIVGDLETEELFEEYVKNGAFFSGSIYLTADDEERVRRIYENDPNDPDLNYPTKWRENNLEDFASSRHLNYYKIDTNHKTPTQVFEEASKFLTRQLSLCHSISDDYDER